MPPDPDIRWRQRFEQFKRGLRQLAAAGQLAETRELSKLEQQGLIQAFEFTHELAWKTLKDLLVARGATARILGSRDATREAFAAELIDDGTVWMRMLESRNASTHTYDEKTADEIAGAIVTRYVGEFQKLQQTLDELEQKEEA